MDKVVATLPTTSTDVIVLRWHPLHSVFARRRKPSGSVQLEYCSVCSPT